LFTITAIHTYQEAAQLAGQDDYLPWSNLSAAYFEAGDYLACIENGLKALQISDHDKSNGISPAASTAFRKLAPRIIKSYLHTHRWKDARSWLEQLKLQAPLSAEVKLFRSIDRAEAAWKAFPDEKKYRLHVQKDLARYRPNL
jgi:hypothetical protein